MANRSFMQYQYSMVKGRVTLFARVTIGAAGASALIAAARDHATVTALYLGRVDDVLCVS